MNQELQTPAFVFDADVLAARVQKIRAAYKNGNIRLCYAVKANPFLVRDLLPLADYFEICSPGEYRICARYGVPPEKVVLSGVYKEESDIFSVVEQCGNKATYTVESIAQYRLLETAAKRYALALPVLFRLSSGNQFGMDEQTIENLLQQASPHLRVLGLQYYGGTQKKTEKIRKEAEKLQSFATALRQKYGFVCKRIEYGPGMGIGYFPAEQPQDEDELLQAAATAFANADEKVLEVGRFLAADCGEYFTRAVDVKQTDGTTYCIVDGGIHHLNYYGQTMAMKVPYMRQERNGKPVRADNRTPYTVCGSLCTTADVLVRACPLRDLQVGDVLVFQKAGAYSVTEGIYLFLSRNMPRIYRRAGGKLTLLRDGLATDPINSIQ